MCLLCLLTCLCATNMRSCIVTSLDIVSTREPMFRILGINNSPPYGTSHALRGNAGGRSRRQGPE